MVTYVKSYVHYSRDNDVVYAPIFVAVNEARVTKVCPKIEDGKVAEDKCIIYVGLSDERFEIATSPVTFIEDVLKAVVYDAGWVMDTSGRSEEDTGEFYS